MSTFRLLFVGDVVGEGGCAAVRTLVPGLRRDLKLDAVIVNGENSAGGLGITADTGRALLSAADFLTLGDHAFDQEGASEYLDRELRVVRPANLDADLPGRGWATFEAADRAVTELEASGAEIILVDVHAEVTSEKRAMGWHLAGRVAAVVGTHTHVPTADLQVLPGGTAYATDVGMTGGQDGIIGFGRDGWLGLFLRNEPLRVAPAAGPVRFDAVLVEVENRRAVEARRICREWRG